MTSLSRTFVIRNPDVMDAAFAFIRANALEMARQDKPLAVTVSEYKAKRKQEQANYYFMRIDEIVRMAWIDGKQFNKTAWHHYYSTKFAPTVQGIKGDPVPKSTTDMSVEEMTDYITEVEADAAQEFGVRFSERQL